MFSKKICRFFVISALVVFGAALALAQESTVKVKVSPPEAYIFVDGQPFAHRSQTITLPTGQHTIGVYNYGFVPQVQTVRLEPGRNPEIVARLEAVPGMATGPWGRVQIEGNENDRAAVFINGVKPEYFVGHVDEMNNDLMATQKLILPVGTYALMLVNPKETEPFFTDKIEVKADQRLVVDVTKKTHTYHDWTQAGHQTSRERFRAGTNTASIAVVPVTGNFMVDKTSIKCGETVRLSWNTMEAAEVFITPFSTQAMPATGERMDSPTQTTTYTFEAKGPGGIVTRTATVHVDPTVQTALTASPAEVHYRRIDDKVVNPGMSTLTWSAANAQTVTLEPMGTVPVNGEKAVPAAPRKTETGSVDEMATYVLTAGNNCGGHDKSLAAVHITGAIETLPLVNLFSVFFPTNYPLPDHPGIGLLASQKDRLEDAATGFRRFLEYDPEARLKVIANADPRSSDEYNMALSERRAEIVKRALVSLGVDSARIDILALGETKQLDKAEVKALEENAGLKRPVSAELVLAYNRRVDLMLIPTQKPLQTSEVRLPREQLVMSSSFKSLRTVEKASALVAETVAALAR